MYVYIIPDIILISEREMVARKERERERKKKNNVREDYGIT